MTLDERKHLCIISTVNKSGADKVIAWKPTVILIGVREGLLAHVPLSPSFVRTMRHFRAAFVPQGTAEAPEEPSQMMSELKNEGVTLIKTEKGCLWILY